MRICSAECREVSESDQDFARKVLRSQSTEEVDNFMVALLHAQTLRPEISKLAVVDIASGQFGVLPIDCYRCLAAAMVLEFQKKVSKRRNVSR